MAFNNSGSSWTPLTVVTGDLSHVLVKIHRQIQRNLPSDRDLHEDIKEFMSTTSNDTVHRWTSNGAPVQRQKLLKDTYQSARRSYNRCQYIRHNLCKFSPAELDASEREFAEYRDQLDLNNNMSQLSSVVKHVKGLLEERRCTGLLEPN